jgi:hypothetical protein
MWQWHWQRQVSWFTNGKTGSFKKKLGFISFSQNCFLWYINVISVLKCYWLIQCLILKLEVLTLLMHIQMTVVIHASVIHFYSACLWFYFSVTRSINVLHAVAVQTAMHIHWVVCAVFLTNPTVLTQSCCFQPQKCAQRPFSALPVLFIFWYSSFPEQKSLCITESPEQWPPPPHI